MKFKFIFLLLVIPALLLACSPPEVERRIPSEFLGGEKFVPENAFTNWLDLEEAIEKAQQADKKILIDVYTDWCGYCRRMDAETYTRDRVQTAINDHFYAVRINAESSERVNYLGQVMSMSDFAMSLGVTGFPTTIFLTNEGEPLGFQPGFIDFNTFERLLVYVGTEAYEQNISFDAFTLD
ncbi:Thioredoxin-related protein [Cyclonatronum proteinivorum]|uniref:Thioredoxin-related protein n=1 Tax=Cyclonatronum proteinivorum TaxID=1457365 RepID=A0A345UNL8_9BACT|nr:thioredoxin fold domain-containing protein [Cyclonatronum proteinivorum]AXJ02070.1 Thioredoxin-related protein [Cyclonatronum proteinivorum]